MIGMSFGTGPMLPAAAGSRIRDKVWVLAMFGGYYDFRNVIYFGLTGAYEYGELHGFVKLDSSARWILAYRNLDILLWSLDDWAVFRKII